MMTPLPIKFPVFASNDLVKCSHRRVSCQSLETGKTSKLAGPQGWQGLKTWTPDDLRGRTESRLLAQ
jgi:hypothetical protein